MSLYFIFIIFIFFKNYCSSPNQETLKKDRNLEELSDDIVILHINDVHCGINDTIGYDGFVLYRDELKKKYKNIISVDVGDHIQGGVLGTLSEGTAIINIMNEVGFDVAILGNHEFDYGIEQLTKLEENIISKYTCANFIYRKNRTTIFQPYKIIEKGGKKIAFIGILTPLAFSLTYLSTIKDSNNELVYDFLANNNAQDLYDKIQEYINKVKVEYFADYVILLTHFGMKEEQYTSDFLLSKLKNVDAILDGHTHKIYNITSKDSEEKDIYIAQTGTKLQSIGKLIIKTDNTIHSEIISEIPEPSDKDNAINIFRGKANRWVDKNMNNLINSIWDRYYNELNLKYGHSDYDLIVKPEDNKDSSAIYCRFKECTLGNLITDAIKDAGNGEITIINGGSVRNNMNKGDLTRGELINILPWFNNIVVKKLTGQCILDALEFGVSKLPLSSGGFPQVSGITFDIDTSFKSTVLTDEYGIFIKVAGERRVSNVKINGENLVLNKEYIASLIEYTAKGGDGYSMLGKFEVHNESLLTDTDAFSVYIQNNLHGEIPKDYQDFQGRINIRDKNDNLPGVLLIGFDKYEYIDNSKQIQFFTYLRLANYLENDIKDITLKVNIIYHYSLRNLEEIEINCVKEGKKQSDIYIFFCSADVQTTVDKLSFSNNIKMNGYNIPNLKIDEISRIMGQNIQNQQHDLLSSDVYILDNSNLIVEDKRIIIRGYCSSTDLSSDNSNLLYVENEQLKNMPCSIEKENDKYKLICIPDSLSNIDLNLNNFVNLEGKNKNLIISFDGGLNSKVKIENKSHNDMNDMKYIGLSTSAIIVIIMLCIGF